MKNLKQLFFLAFIFTFAIAISFAQDYKTTDIFEGKWVNTFKNRAGEERIVTIVARNGFFTEYLTFTAHLDDGLFKGTYAVIRNTVTLTYTRMKDDDGVWKEHKFTETGTISGNTFTSGEYQITYTKQ